MKTNNALLAFFFFFFALFAISKAEYVRDSEGHLVRNGGTYYIKPVDIDDSVIGNTSITNPDGTCSLAVVEKFKSGHIAVRFESSSRDPYLKTDLSIVISFYHLPPNPCTEIPTWLVNKDDDFQEDAVMAGDPSTFSSPVSGSFVFTTVDFAHHIYGFLFCRQCRCKDIAIKIDTFENNRRLIVNNGQIVNPLGFKLVPTELHICPVV